MHVHSFSQFGLIFPMFFFLFSGLTRTVNELRSYANTHSHHTSPLYSDFSGTFAAVFHIVRFAFSHVFLHFPIFPWALIVNWRINSSDYTFEHAIFRVKTEPSYVVFTAVFNIFRFCCFLCFFSIFLFFRSTRTVNRFVREYMLETWYVVLTVRWRSVSACLMLRSWSNKREIH